MCERILLQARHCLFASAESILGANVAHDLFPAFMILLPFNLPTIPLKTVGA
jgi:hypothetical protein